MRSLALTLAALVAIPFASGRQDQAPPPLGEHEATALLDAWDSLGFPTVQAESAVRAHYWGGDVIGFLGQGSEGEQYLFLANLREIDAKPKASAPDQGTTYESVALAEAISAYVLEVSNGSFVQTDMNPLPARAQFVHLAAICRASGHGTLVGLLLDEANAQEEYYDRYPGSPLQERVWKDLEHTLQLRAWTEFTGTQNRKAAFERFVERFPDSQHAAEAQHFMRVIARMQGNESAVPTEEALAGLTGDALAEGLVSRLRYLVNYGFSTNGGPPSLFALDRGHPPSAAERLFALGEAAVPALIAAVDDDTLTPISYPGRAGWNAHVMSVGDVAQTVLGKITGEAPRAGAAGWKVWWQRQHEGDEIVALVDAVLERDARSLDAARQLAAKGPGVAVWPIEHALLESGLDWQNLDDRLPWVEIYSQIQHERVPVFLAGQARAGGRLTHQVAAALALEPTDPAAALAAAERLAYHLPAASHAVPQRSIGRLAPLVNAENRAARRLIAFLVDRDALDVFVERFDRLGTHLRVELALRVAEHLSGPNAAGRELSAQARRLLCHSLQDASLLTDDLVLESVRGISGARVCDAAALALCTCSPRTFEFEAGADASVRGKQAAVIADALER